MMMACPGDRPPVLNPFRQLGEGQSFFESLLSLKKTKPKRHIFGWPILIPHTGS